MELKAVLSFLIFTVFFVDYLEGTFGDEFVHIKVHVPKEVSHTRGRLKPIHLGSPAHPYTSHKVIHHVHKRRKHLRKHPTAHLKTPPLESIILEELDKSKEQEDPEETYVIEEIPQEEEVDTYKVIEETVRKPHPVKKKLVNTIEIIESPSKHHKDYASYEQDHHYSSYDNDDEKSHYPYKPSHSETVEIIKTKNSARPYPAPHSHYYEYEDSHAYKPPKGYHKESIEVINTKSSPKYHHKTLEYESHDHYATKPVGKQVVELQKEIVYSKPTRMYANPKVVIEKHLEYEKPYANYKGHYEDYEQPLLTYRQPTSIAKEHSVYEVNEDNEHGYHYSPPAEYFDNVRGESGYYERHSHPAQSQKSYHYERLKADGSLASSAEDRTVDWPEAAKDEHNSESYMGHDSYSAAHAQGVDSGEYHYPPLRRKDE